MILNLGSGIENLYNQDHFVNFDIYPHHNVDVVGDGHFLPFLPETFDVVWLCAVLEHIRKPWLLCNQVARVLKPGGKVLVSAPFIQKGHGAPYDFFRYTPEGLRSLFDDFEEIECGPSYTRPSGTLVHVIGAWANAVFPGKLGRMVELCLLWGLGWLKMIDKVAPPSSLGWTMAGGSCYLGRKPMQLQDIKSP
jgi:SAM-dependent methyltransferase